MEGPNLAIGGEGVELSGSNVTYVVIAAAIALLALGVAAALVRAVLSAGQGTTKMQEIAAAVQEGAAAYLARQFKTLGIFVVVAVILLFVQDHMPLAGLVVILGRDLLLLAGYKTIAPPGYQVNVNFLGKAATWLLYAGIGFLIVTDPSTDWPYWIFWTGLVLAVVAGLMYGLTAWREGRR